MSRLTAQEARELAGINIIDMAIDELLEAIKKNANKRIIKTDYCSDIKLYKSFWHGGYDNNFKWVTAKKTLENLGYEVTFYYSEESYFADMYTKITW